MVAERSNLIFESDWLGTKPFFYNEKTGSAGYNINDVIDYANLEFDPEGFNNYLDFGYSVFEQTPVKHVKFLRHSSRLWRDESNRLRIEYLDDPVEKWNNRIISEDDIWERLRSMVADWEAKSAGEIILPLSGGYDSRALLLMIQNKERIRAFTYGHSSPQIESYEVVHASKLAELANLKWVFIELGDFHKYLDKWYELYGVSTHAHGMYQIEFHSKLGELVRNGASLISGLIGDAWAGGKPMLPVTSASQLKRLGLTHGMNADSQFSLLPPRHDIIQLYFYKHQRQLMSEFGVTIESMRAKMILLSYLLHIPETVGLKAYAPFIDMDLALSMLTLPENRRRNRLWQKEYFVKQGVFCEDMGLKGRRIHTLNRQALRNVPLPPLDVKLLGEYVRSDYIDWINKFIQSVPRPAWWLDPVLNIPKLGGALKRLGVPKSDPFNKPYNAYLTLKPIEMLLRRAGQHV